MIPRDLPAGVFEHPLLAGHDWTLRRRINGRHTDLLEFRDARRGNRIFVKRLHESRHGGADGRLRREHRALQVLQWRLDPEMRHSLPAPLGAHQNGSILVVTGVEGCPLSHVLKRDANRLTGLLRRRQLSANGAMVGTWLRRFHDATSRAPMPHDHERFCRDVNAALQRLGAAAGTEGLAGVNDRLARASARLDGTPLATAAGHGDFLPQNVLIRRDSAAVVDFENYRLRETVHRDAGAMLAYTMMLQRQRRYHAGALRVFAAAFEHGYGGRLRTDVQRLFTAEGAVRIARDSAQPRTRHIMLATVAALMAENETELEA